MAKETTVGFLPGNDPEAAQANMAYQEALTRMQEALDARKNRFIDPSALALAQGFLAPTQTGGFGESLGYAAKNLREAQMQEEKEERDIAQAQLGLAGKGIELERMRQRDRAFDSLIGGPLTTLSTSGATPTRPTGGVLPTTQTARGPLSDPVGLENLPSVQISPPNPNFMTGRQYLSMARMDPSISPADAAIKAQQMEKDRVEVRDKLIYDRASGKGYYPTAEIVETEIFGYPGKYRISGIDALELQVLASQGNPKYHERAKQILEGPKAQKVTGPSVDGEPSKPVSAASGRKESVGEREAREAGEKETATERAKYQEKDRQKAMEAGSAARQAMTSYNIIDRIVSGPNADKLTGVFERPGFWAQIGKLAESGIGTQGFSVGIRSLRDIMTQAGLPQELIDQSQVLGSELAKIQLQISRLGEGQGSVSDFERSLFGQAGLTVKDNPRTIQAKVGLLRAEAEFQQKVASGLRKFKGSIDDFKETPQYQQMVDEYKEKANQTWEKAFGTKSPGREAAPSAAPPGSAAPSGRDNKGAAGRLPI